jgi:hypothetical protein
LLLRTKAASFGFSIDEYRPLNRKFRANWYRLIDATYFALTHRVNIPTQAIARYDFAGKQEHQIDLPPVLLVEIDVSAVATPVAQSGFKLT